MKQNFNSFEKAIANFLSSSPKIKRLIKKSYSLLSYSINKKKYKYDLISDIFILGDKSNDTFFGYYDKHPDNSQGLILVYSSPHGTKQKPQLVDEIQLDVYSLELKKYILPEKINITAFNWQQGSRAQWLNNDKFIFNNYDLNSDSYYSEIYSISESRVIETINLPVQDSFHDKYFLSLCYKTLSLLRPDYGYFKHKIKELPDYHSVGIWKYDYKNENSSLIIKMIDVINYNTTNKKVSNYKHKLNHIMISPNGEKFIFMHRYFNNDGQRFDRLILADSNGSLIKILADNNMVSHCYWYDDNTILGYLRSPSNIDAYWLIDINSSNYKPLDSLNTSSKSDGHPSVLADYIITDTYPNKARMQSLFLTKKNCDHAIKLGELFHGFEYSDETRCDLHPRFSSCGRYVFFDSVFSGKRQLCYIDICNEKSKL